MSKKLNRQKATVAADTLGLIRALPIGLTTNVRAGKCFKKVGLIDPKAQFVDEGLKGSTAIVDALFGMSSR